MAFRPSIAWPSRNRNDRYGRENTAPLLLAMSTVIKLVLVAVIVNAAARVGLAPMAAVVIT